MNASFKKQESGQVIILLLLAMVGLLGISALAIDGGMLYSDRRYIQNAADTGALAGAGVVGKYFHDNGIYAQDWDCNVTGGHVDNAMGLAYAKADETTKYNAPDHENVVVNVWCDDANMMVIVEVGATKITPTSLTHMVFRDALKNAVTAHASVKPRTPFVAGQSIISLTENCGNANDRGTVVGGGATVNVIGGGMWSNSCLIFDGSNIEVNAGSLTHIRPEEEGGVVYNGSDHEINGDIIEGDDPITVEIEQPKCEDLANDYGNYSGPGNIQPGRYNRIHVASGDLTMSPGLYCINDGGFTFQGNNLTGYGVTIVVLGHHSFSTAASSTVKLHAPIVGCETNDPSCSPAVGGLLLWRETDRNPDEVSLLGNSDSEFVGTVYAPNSTIKIGGNADLSNPTDYSTQLIGNTVRMMGNSAVNITYNDSFIAYDYTKLNLVQ